MDGDQIRRLAEESGAGLIETHISWLLLGRGEVHKIKKPLKLSFLDFSTPELRMHFCHEEVRLNRRLSPDVYLGVVPVTAEGGRVSIGGAGETIDHAVRMRRLDEGRKMDRMLAAGRVDEGLVRGIARMVADFHSDAEPVRGQYGSPGLVWGQIADLGAHRGTIERASGLGRWSDGILAASEAWIRRNRGLMEARVAEGFVRDCHGDLHCGNIFLEDGIRIIDCIEFSPDFRRIDVASDIAFMAMDLDHSGREDLSRAFVEEYVSRSGDTDARRLLPLYKCYRANVRAKIAAIELEQGAGGQSRERMDGYLLLASKYAREM